MATDTLGRPLPKGTFVLYTTATRSNKISLGILREDTPPMRNVSRYRYGTCKVLKIDVSTIEYSREERRHVERDIPLVTSKKTTLHHIPWYAVDPHAFVPIQVLPEVLELQRQVMAED